MSLWVDEELTSLQWRLAGAASARPDGVIALRGLVVRGEEGGGDGDGGIVVWR